MKNKTTLELVRSVVGDQMGGDELRADPTNDAWDDFPFTEDPFMLDDLDYIEISMALEDELDIDLPDDEFSMDSGPRTITELAKLLEGKVRK